MASTYYVSAATGNDSDTGLTEALAWLTVDKAMNTVATGDKVWVKADGNYAELATIDTVGTTTAPIVFEGYTTTTGDGGRATITGSSARANCVVNNAALTTAAYYVFKNFQFTAATAEGVKMGSSSVYTFKNCKFDNNGTRGLSAKLVRCEECEFSSNTTEGCIVPSSKGCFIGCSFYSNKGAGLFFDGGLGVVLFSVFFSNAGNAIEGGGDNDLFIVVGCTVDGDSKNTDDGLTINSASSLPVVVNNAFYDCTTGINSAGDRGELVLSRNNLVNANTTAYVNVATFTGEITSAPQFTNEVGGADYHPDTGSPLRDAGFDRGASMDIGAVQSVAGAASNVFKLRIGV